MKLNKICAIMAFSILASLITLSAASRPSLSAPKTEDQLKQVNKVIDTIPPRVDPSLLSSFIDKAIEKNESELLTAKDDNLKQALTEKSQHLSTLSYITNTNEKNCELSIMKELTEVSDAYHKFASGSTSNLIDYLLRKQLKLCKQVWASGLAGIVEKLSEKSLLIHTLYSDLDSANSNRAVHRYYRGESDIVDIYSLTNDISPKGLLLYLIRSTDLPTNLDEVKFKQIFSSSLVEGCRSNGKTLESGTVFLPYLFNWSLGYSFILGQIVDKLNSIFFEWLGTKQACCKIVTNSDKLAEDTYELYKSIKDTLELQKFTTLAPGRVSKGGAVRELTQSCPAFA